jgi:PIN domain nuclease of toxin-antitoxin system
VTYVADTHALVFFATGDLRRLSPKGRRIFERAEAQRDRVHIPVICFFEVALLLEHGRLRSRLSFEDWYSLIAAHPGLPVEGLMWDDIREARGLAGLADPFDRLIAGTALRLDAPLVTNDARIRASGLVRTIW